MRKTLKISLNGTASNPYFVYGLTQNPFPQLGEYRYDAFEDLMASLGGDPIPDTTYIRTKLTGFVSQELVELCCQNFRKGEIVKFMITWDDGKTEPIV